MPKRFHSFFSLWLASLILFGLVGLPATTGAAEELTVSPARIEELVEPGEVFEQSISVTNNSDAAKKLSAYLRDFTAEGEEGKARLIVPGSEEGSFLSSWIKSESESQDFQPGETRIFKFTINVPKEAGPGGYYGAIIFGTKAPEVREQLQGQGAAIGISQQAGALLLFQIKGQADERAQIREFTTDRGVYNTPFEVKLASRVENQGNVHVRPRGTIEIFNLLGNKVATLSVNGRSANILPKSVRRFDNSWTGNFGFGRYRALLALAYGTSPADGGGGMQTLTSVKYFWVLPYKLLAYAGLGLLLLLVIAYLFLRMYKHRAIKEAMRGLGVGKEVYVKKTQGGTPGSHLGLIFIVIAALAVLLALAAYFLFFA